MKIEDSIALGLFVIVIIMMLLSLRASPKNKKKAKLVPFEAGSIDKINNDKFFQVDSTYYSYTKTCFFYTFLFKQKNFLNPYCEKCRKWVHIYERMLGIPVTEKVISEFYESDIVKSLIAGNWSVLKTSGRLTTLRIIQPAIFIALGRCETCDGPFRVVGEVHGRDNNGTIYVGSFFAMEIDKKSALELLEAAIDRNLISNGAMYAKAVDFCKKLGSSKDFAQMAKARALGSRGLWELDHGRLDEAEANLNSALQIFEELEESTDQAIAYRSLASVYYRRKDLDDAETLAKKSLVFFEELNDKPEMAIGYGVLGQIQFDLKEFDQAERLVWKALEIDTTMGNKRGMATGYRALGAVYQALNKRERAKATYAEALKLYQELGDLSLVKNMQTELDRL